MKAILSFCIEVASEQQAASLRDQVAEWLGEQGAQVTSSVMGQQTHDFKVVGVNTSNKQPFREKVQAVDPTEAEAIAVAGSKTKVVADVQRWV